MRRVFWCHNHPSEGVLPITVVRGKCKTSEALIVMQPLDETLREG